jgi:hypothetical protein
MRLLPAHQVDVAHRPPRFGRQWRRPDQAGGSVAEQVNGEHGRDVVDRRQLLERSSRAPAVPGLVEVEAYRVAPEVDDVRHPRPVDVGEADPLLVEEVGRVEPGRRVHRHARAEAAVPEIRPVAHLAVANPDEVGQPVAGHVGEVDRVGAVGEDQAGPAFFVQRLRDALGRAESGFAQRRVPGKERVLRDQDVRVTVAGQIDESQVGVVPGKVRHRVEWHEVDPARVLGALVEAW